MQKGQTALHRHQQPHRLLQLEVSLTLKDIGRTHVNLGDNHKDRYIECQCQAQVLLGHPHDASITAHLPQQKGTVRTRRQRLLLGKWGLQPAGESWAGEVHLTELWRRGLTPEKQAPATKPLTPATQKPELEACLGYRELLEPA